MGCRTMTALVVTGRVSRRARAPRRDAIPRVSHTSCSRGTDRYSNVLLTRDRCPRTLLLGDHHDVATPRAADAEMQFTEACSEAAHLDPQGSGRHLASVLHRFEQSLVGDGGADARGERGREPGLDRAQRDDPSAVVQTIVVVDERRRMVQLRLAAPARPAGRGDLAPRPGCGPSPRGIRSASVARRRHRRGRERRRRRRRAGPLPRALPATGSRRPQPSPSSSLGSSGSSQRKPSPGSVMK